jgi:hypothetical protein
VKTLFSEKIYFWHCHIMSSRDTGVCASPTIVRHSRRRKNLLLTPESGSSNQQDEEPELGIKCGYLQLKPSPRAKAASPKTVPKVVEPISVPTKPRRRKQPSLKRRMERRMAALQKLEQKPCYCAARPQPSGLGHVWCKTKADGKVQRAQIGDNGLTIQEKSGEFINSSAWYRAASSRQTRAQQQAQRSQMGTPMPQGSRRRRFFSGNSNDSAKGKTKIMKSNTTTTTIDSSASGSKYNGRDETGCSPTGEKYSHLQSSTKNNSASTAGTSESEEWMKLWDPGYQHTYYFNRWTGDSQWHPPPGFPAKGRQE